MIWDSHIHTCFSGDCDTEIPDIIKQAQKQNLPGITITDHLDLVYPEHMRNISNPSWRISDVGTALMSMDIWIMLSDTARMTEHPYDPMDYMDLFDEILKELITRGKGIEVNTAGLSYGLSHPHPAIPIIQRYRDLGGEILTIGSDAHKKENVGYAFAQIPDLLRACGFHYYCVFQNRKPEFLPL